MNTSLDPRDHESLRDTVDGGEPTTGEKENTEQTKQRPRPQTGRTKPFRCGIELPWGDEIEENPRDATRIFFQNVNGISSASTNLWQRLKSPTMLT
jgi:hypothetical protein